MENNWISVRDKLPNDFQTVLFCDIDNDIMLGYHTYGAPRTHFIEKGSWDMIKNVKAWQTLPEPYRGDDNGNDD